MYVPYYKRILARKVNGTDVYVQKFNNDFTLIYYNTSEVLVFN